MVAEVVSSTQSKSMRRFHWRRSTGCRRLCLSPVAVHNRYRPKLVKYIGWFTAAAQALSGSAVSRNESASRSDVVSDMLLLRSDGAGSSENRIWRAKARCVGCPLN